MDGQQNYINLHNVTHPVEGSLRRIDQILDLRIPGGKAKTAAFFWFVFWGGSAKNPQDSGFMRWFLPTPRRGETQDGAIQK